MPVNERNLLILFSKEPVPGKVKTRLVPHLGEQGAYELYLKLFNATLENALNFTQSTLLLREDLRTDLQVWLAGSTSNAYAQGLQKHPLQLRQQVGSDLGEAMSHALCVSSGMSNAITNDVSAKPSSLETGQGKTKVFDKVVIIGGDCVSVDGDYLQEAFTRLQHCDCVVGPAEDGGFVLIGINIASDSQAASWQQALLKNAPSPLFDNIKWGGSDVLKDLLKNLKKLELSLSLLDERWDVDELEDLSRLSSLPNF